MSAFVVSKHHIDVLVSAAIDLEMTARVEGWEQRVNFGNADAVGCMLWGENARSVNFRYRLWFENQSEALTYQADVAAYRFHFYPMIRAGAAAKALACFEYQSCGCDDSEASVRALFGRAIFPDGRQGSHGCIIQILRILQTTSSWCGP